MALDSATNFVRQTVGSAVGTSDPETIDVQDASAFADPSVSQYDIAIFDAGTHDGPYQDPNAEVLTVTARDTTADTLTCARGQQNTANVSHPDTSDVIVAVLAEQDVKDLDAQTVTTESLVIGGTLYEEDANSPFTPSSASSATYTISGTYDEVIIVPERDNEGYNQMRVNGNSDTNYRYVNNADSQTSGASEISMGIRTRNQRLISVGINDAESFAGFNFQPIGSQTGGTLYGRYVGTVNSLDSFTVLDSGGSNQSLDARVFGRVMSI